MGNWLSQKQAQTLLNTPDIATLKGLRDRASQRLPFGSTVKWASAPGGLDKCRSL
ncbi:MAG TPA: hypothetical protein VMR62_02805 [Bryobacteraceae bacterium]|jgi:hypothetical protein|nr:hypothetical protein [Bryobacteraceae bacterium]